MKSTNKSTNIFLNGVGTICSNLSINSELQSSQKTAKMLINSGFLSYNSLNN
jgi:hypothetical protein